MGKVMSMPGKPIASNSLKQIKRNSIPSGNVQNTKTRVRAEPSAEFEERIHRFDIAFNERLKHVYVSSKSTENTLVSNKLDQTAAFRAPNVPIRKLTIQQLSSVLWANQKYPNEWTPLKVSENLDIDIDSADKLLKHFGYFGMYIPKDGEIEVTVNVERTKKETELDLDEYKQKVETLREKIQEEASSDEKR